MQEESPHPACFIPCSQLLHWDRELASPYSYSPSYPELCRHLFFLNYPSSRLERLLHKPLYWRLHCFCPSSNLGLSLFVLVLVLCHPHSLPSSACRVGIVKVILSSCRTVVTQWSTSIIPIKAIQNTLLPKALPRTQKSNNSTYQGQEKTVLI